MNIDEKMARRFWSKVDRSGGPAACWLWQGARHSAGYGWFSVSATHRAVRAHRIAYELTKGRIPSEKPYVLHDCDNPPCVNPAHLRAGTQAENIQACARRGRHISQACPERLARGDRNGSRTKPESLARGEQHGSRTKPEHMQRGEQHALAKLTADQVREIRRRYAAGGISVSRLAAEYGMSRTPIRDIVRRKTWAHVLDDGESAEKLVV